MKYILIFSIVFLLTSCSNPLDGLWIESREIALLKFDRDSVIYNSLSTDEFFDTWGFKKNRDSIIFTGLNPRFDGTTEKSFGYILNGDSLQIWTNPSEKLIYLRSAADNFKEHFLSKDGLKLKLPKAENVGRKYFSDNIILDIRIGFKDEEVKTFIDDNETNIYDLDRSIKDFKSRNEDWPFLIECDVFVDEKVTCDYTFSVLDHLMANDLRIIRFITETDRYNPYSRDFFGITVPVTRLYKLRITEKNER
jgi:hypothetical protein